MRLADYNAPMIRLNRPSTLVLATPFVLLLQLVIVGCGPSDPLEAIKQAQAEGRLAETLEPLRELLDERPGDPEVLFLYGRTLSAMGKAGLAEWSLREAMRDPDWTAAAGMQLAMDSARGANFEAAIEVASIILESEPDNIEALTIRASSYTHSRMYHEEALADAERVLELDPENLEIMEPKILALIGLERFDEVGVAMEELGRKIDESELGGGVSAWHCATTAIFAQDSGDTALADTRWVNCLESYPSDPEVVAKGVRFYDSQGRYDRSAEILQTALKEDPLGRSFRVNLSGRLRASGQVEEAESLLLTATESERPEISSAAWLDLAKHYQAVEDYPAAADSVGKAFEIVESVSQPDSAMLLEYADALLIAGRFDESLAIADRMTHEPHEQMIRARIAQEQRDYAAALEYFEKAFRLWPDNPFARYYAAMAAESIGDFDLAIEQYRYSVRISAGATDSRTRAARIYQAEDRPGLAIQILRIKAQDDPLEPPAEILSLELWAITNRAAELEASLKKIRAAAPTYVGEALASVAKGIRHRAGASAAVSSLVRAGNIDIADLNHADALRALVQYAHESGELKGVSEKVDAALAANPDAGRVREIVAYHLELAGAPDDEVRAAFNATLEVDPENVRALAGIARLALKSGNHEEALTYFDRANAEAPTDMGLAVSAVRSMLALGQDAEAEVRLGSIVEAESFNAEASGLLAEIRLARGETDERTLDLSKRAARFGRGAADFALLARVHTARGESEQARKATERAQEP